MSEIENLKEFKNIFLDASLKEGDYCKIKNLVATKDERVEIRGWVQEIQKKSEKLWIIKVTDGTGYVECVFKDNLCQTKEALQLSCQSSISVYGKIKKLSPENKSIDRYELCCDHCELIKGVEITGGVESIVNAHSEPYLQFENWNLMISKENTYKVIKMQSIVLKAFRKHFENNGFQEVYPPTFVKSQCEGESTQFKFDFDGEEVYLSQSSQLYLEMFLPDFGKCFSISRSYSTNKNQHLSQYTKIEAESCFITFEDLLQQIEDMLVDVSEIVSEIGGKTLLEINPEYKPLKKPFMRIDYKDALVFLKEHDIQKPEGGDYEFGDDIPEAAERKMTDIIKEPIMLIRFPVELKSFYMSKCKDDARVTESVDVLIPGVGEIVGGSMRIWDTEELLAGYAREGLDPAPYYWYTDMRKVGSCPHGGYGLGFERFLTWMMNKDHIRDVCLYPRYAGRCRP